MPEKSRKNNTCPWGSWANDSCNAPGKHAKALPEAEMTSYKEAGVDVEAKERTIEEIKKSVRSTFTKDVLGSETTFKYGGVISLKALKDYEEPVLVLSTDGVGTKMEIAAKLGKFDTVG